jgi:hypothetical protein
MKWKKYDPMYPNDTVFIIEKDAVFQKGKNLVIWVVKGKLSQEQIDKICKEGLRGYETRRMKNE